MSDHRAWWAAAVAAAVPSPSTQVGASDGYPGVAAPYADLVARVGAPTAAVENSDRRAGIETGRQGDLPLPLRPPVLLLTTLVALVAEWASRRLRGLR